MCAWDTQEAKVHVHVGGHAGMKGCVHTGVNAGVKGSLHAGTETCVCARPHRVGMYVCTCMCVYSGYAEACVSPQGTSPLQTAQALCYFRHLPAWGLQGRPSPACALQSRQHAQLPRVLPSSRLLLWQATFSNTRTAFPCAWCRPITPRCPPATTRNCLPSQHPGVCAAVCGCVYL